MTYGQPFSIGFFSVNFSVTKLKADLTENFILRGTSIDSHLPLPAEIPGTRSLDGNTYAYGLGLNWKAPITKNFSYDLSISCSRYTFDELFKEK